MRSTESIDPMQPVFGNISVDKRIGGNQGKFENEKQAQADCDEREEQIKTAMSRNRCPERWWGRGQGAPIITNGVLRFAAKGYCEISSSARARVGGPKGATASTTISMAPAMNANTAPAPNFSSRKPMAKLLRTVEMRLKE